MLVRRLIHVMRLLEWSFSRRWVNVLNAMKVGNMTRRLVV